MHDVQVPEIAVIRKFKIFQLQVSNAPGKKRHANDEWKQFADSIRPVQEKYKFKPVFGVIGNHKCKYKNQKAGKYLLIKAIQKKYWPNKRNTMKHRLHRTLVLYKLMSREYSMQSGKEYYKTQSIFP